MFEGDRCVRRPLVGLMHDFQCQYKRAAHEKHRQDCSYRAGRQMRGKLECAGNEKQPEKAENGRHEQLAGIGTLDGPKTYGGPNRQTDQADEDERHEEEERYDLLLLIVDDHHAHPRFRRFGV